MSSCYISILMLKLMTCIQHNHKVVLTQEIKIHARIDLCYGHIKKKQSLGMQI